LSTPSWWTLYPDYNSIRREARRVRREIENEKNRKARAANPERYKKQTREAVRRHRARKNGSALA
jgi:hypothetical protein